MAAWALMDDGPCLDDDPEARVEQERSPDHMPKSRRARGTLVHGGLPLSLKHNVCEDEIPEPLELPELPRAGICCTAQEEVPRSEAGSRGGDGRRCPRCNSFFQGPTDGSAFARALRQLCEARDEELGSLRIASSGSNGQAAGEDPELESLDPQDSVSFDRAGSICVVSGKGSMDGTESMATAMNVQVLISHWSRFTTALLLEQHGKVPAGRRTFEVRDEWFFPATASHRRNGIKEGMVTVKMHALMTKDFTTVGESIVDHSQLLQRFVLEPTGKKIISWMCFGALLLLWDAIMIPFFLTELVPASPALSAINLLVTIYWCLDLPLQFLIGFGTPAGLVEMRPSEIREGYLRSRFGFDMLVVSIDVVYLLALQLFPDNGEGSSATTSSIRVARVLRTLRIVRLLRARRLQGHFKQISERMKDSRVVLILKILKFVVIIMFINHYVACGWCGVHFFGNSEGENGWLERMQVHSYSVKDCYVLALHWSLTQFSPSTTDIAPVTPPERLYACITSLVAMLVFTTFVSGLTSSVNQLGLANANKFVEEARIRDFLHRREVSTHLFAKLFSFFHGPYQTQKDRLEVKDLPFFEQLPEALRSELHLEMYGSFVLESRLLGSRLYRSYRPLLKAVCREAMSMYSVLQNQDIFTQSASTGIYCFAKGDGIYELANENAEVQRLSQRFSADIHLSKFRIVPKMWLAELTLLTPWQHSGTLVATVFSDVVKIHPDKFFACTADVQENVMKSLRGMALLLVHYAETMETEVDFMTDMPLDYDVIDTVCERATAISKMKLGL